MPDSLRQQIASPKEISICTGATFRSRANLDKSTLPRQLISAPIQNRKPIRRCMPLRCCDCYSLQCCIKWLPLNALLLLQTVIAPFARTKRARYYIVLNRVNVIPKIIVGDGVLITLSHCRYFLAHCSRLWLIVPSSRTIVQFVFTPGCYSVRPW